MFFKTKETIPPELGFNTFGPTHILWLLAGLIFCVGACAFYKKLDKKQQKAILQTLGTVIVLMELVKDIVLIITGQFTWEHLPFHLCGINILLIGYDVFQQKETIRSFLYYFCIPGAMLALLFPNWTMLPFWNFFHLHSFIVHILLVLYPLLLVSTGQVQTEFKAALKGVGLLLAMAVPVYVLNLLLGTNFMFLMQPDSGNPLELFEALLGSHLWGFPILLPLVLLLMRAPVLLLEQLNKQKNP